jgi:hypothetical protein
MISVPGCEDVLAVQCRNLPESDAGQQGEQRGQEPDRFHVRQPSTEKLLLCESLVLFPGRTGRIILPGW